MVDCSRMVFRLFATVLIDLLPCGYNAHQSPRSSRVGRLRKVCRFRQNWITGCPQAGGCQMLPKCCRNVGRQVVGQVVGLRWLAAGNSGPIPRSSRRLTGIECLDQQPVRQLIHSAGRYGVTRRTLRFAGYGVFARRGGCTGRGGCRACMAKRGFLGGDHVDLPRPPQKSL
jgi:hypothetical protein